MGDISKGSVSSMPGSIHPLPLNSKCDDHPERDAIKRVQGETDSFGCEYLDMCQKCFDNYKQEVSEADYSGKCEWCKKCSDHLYLHRDIEEGSCGPVYEVCQDCIDKERESWQEEDDRRA